MSIAVRNLQQVVKFNVSQLHFDISLLLKLAGFQSYDLGVMLVCNDEIRKLNAAYRDTDEVTDVLAFPYHEISPENAGQIPDVEEMEQMLGDIVLGIPYIYDESRKHMEHFDSVVLTMVTHGIFHLVGYDHETQDQWSQMYNKELDILGKFNKLTGYQCSPLLGVGHYVET
uniref:Uncharacterized protein n=2 Tax=Arion vulgaris TaxID=1028688 RepID=A0A0B6YQM5_9EUPU